MSILVSVANAQSNADALGRVLNPIISNVIDPLVGLAFAVAIVVFAYGVFEMIWKGGDATAREIGRRHMLWGIVGIFIMMSAWGIIYLISNSIKAL